MTNPFADHCKTLEGTDLKYFDLPSLNDPRYDALPYSIRVLLESTVRNCDNFEVRREDVDTILDWPKTSEEQKEIAFKPARVLLQDFTGVPCVADMAVMRDAIVELGGQASDVNPMIPTDLVIDHSVIADYYGNSEALQKNEEMEFQRNKERFAFLKWGQKALKNTTITPPGSGIVHQVNLEYLGRLVMKHEGMLYPDSLVGTDSHTTMIDGLGIVGWGVGGIEAEAVMLGQPISMLLPQVVGFKMTGKMSDICTATDLVLTVTKMLRERKVVGKFVEFFGPGCDTLSVADRATIANMSPEYGATMGFFPVDSKTIEYLKQTGRNPADLELFEKYLCKQKLFRTYGPDANDSAVKYSGAVVELDLATVVPSLAGPKRPQDRVSVSDLMKEFDGGLIAPVSFKGFGLPNEKTKDTAEISMKGQKCTLSHGSVVIAAITSCTNTSNPMVMIGAGLLARNAVEKGLKVPPFVKTTLSPGSGVVQSYLESSNLLKPLQELGFYLAGFGCMTCIGNSGELDNEVAEAIKKSNLIVAGVLSGNRNFEGRIHPLTPANYLASPMLVVAYALSGTVRIDFENTPLGSSKEGKNVFLRDIWPSRAEIQKTVDEHLKVEMFKDVYSRVTKGNSNWNSLNVPASDMYQWNEVSTYVHRPPFFDGMKMKLDEVQNIDKAYCLLNLGDSITTDHISPAGKIAKESPAGQYLISKGVQSIDFNSYGSRRGHDEVMVRGTFANVRLVNKMVKSVGPKTINVVDGTEDYVYNVAMKYKERGCGSIILAGAEYGCGSSRDWAAKGVLLQGVRGVIAKSYERIHRSNLVGMGVLPLEFINNESADTLGLTGNERFSINLENGDIGIGEILTVDVFDKDGKSLKSFKTKCRIDSSVEIEYFKNGGILQYVLRKVVKK